MANWKRTEAIKAMVSYSHYNVSVLIHYIYVHDWQNVGGSMAMVSMSCARLHKAWDCTTLIHLFYSYIYIYLYIYIYIYKCVYI